MIPAQIGAYQVVDGPRAGGMSLVYGAIQPHLDRMVALKVLSPDLERDATAVERFKHEATIAARLKHDNIVTIYEANVRDPQPPYYIAMEFLRGGTLAERLAPRRPLPHDQIRWLMGQICAGLEHAHRHGVVHRDIKPANIMFEESGRPKITDFGISRAGGSGNLTMVGARVGTPDYMSPEQASGKEATYLSDLYALGVVLYEMLTGRPPFSSPQPLVTMRQIVDEAPPRPTGSNSTIPARVEAVVLRALDKDPARRYQSAGELHRALQRAYQDTTQIAGQRGKTALLVGLLSIVLVGVGLVAWTGTHQGFGGGGGGGAPHPPPRPAVVSGPQGPPLGPGATRAPGAGPGGVQPVAGGGTISTPSEKDVPQIVPKLIGLSKDDAVKKAKGLSVAWKQGYRDGYADGAICDQDPKPGEELPPGGQLILTVSRGQGEAAGVRTTSSGGGKKRRGSSKQGSGGAKRAAKGGGGGAGGGGGGSNSDVVWKPQRTGDAGR